MLQIPIKCQLPNLMCATNNALPCEGLNESLDGGAWLYMSFPEATPMHHH